MVLHFPSGEPLEEQDVRNGGTKPEYGDIVLVDWVDSCGSSFKWTRPVDVQEFDVDQCRSVGFFCRWDKTDLVIVAGHSEYMLSDVSAIPASCIMNLVVLLKGDGRVPTS